VGSAILAYELQMADPEVKVIRISRGLGGARREFARTPVTPVLEGHDMNSYLIAGLGVLAGLGLGVGGLLLLGCGSTAVRGKPFNPASPTFPQVTGDNLNGRRFEIPGGLDAPFNILLVAFHRGQQDDVDTWLATACEMASAHANVEYYELPTINSGWGLVRNWIDGGMRGGIPDFGTRDRTITLYTDTAKFRELAGIDGPEQIWVGLVDREGRVFWSARGRATEDSLRALRQAVADTASPAVSGHP
jgi:hypothetical protein